MSKLDDHFDYIGKRMNQITKLRRLYRLHKENTDRTWPDARTTINASIRRMRTEIADEVERFNHRERIQ